jgi:diguanylate cyclase (GGDEF)-like protein
MAATQHSPSSVVAAIARKTFIRTVVAVGTSVVLTSLIMLAIVGADGDKTIRVVTFWQMGLTTAVVVPLVICPLMAIQIQRVILALRAAQDALALIAKTDALTGLLNRRGFDEAALQAFTDPGRADKPIAALMCDIDLFKAINDKHGHEFGDLVLIDVARIIRSSLHDRDTVIGRQGGEEFVVLLPGLGMHEAREVAEDIRKACAAWLFDGEGRCARITLSIGIAIAFVERATLRELIGQADAGLYQAKRAGRNRVDVVVKPAAIVA